MSKYLPCLIVLICVCLHEVDSKIESSNQTSTTERGCTCIVYSKCSAEPVVNKCEESHVGGIIDEITKNCAYYLEVCCPNNHIIKSCPDPTVPPRQGCGHYTPGGVVAIGFIDALNDEADYGEFPWMVAIAVQNSISRTYQCGGSLISKYVVLTAAHCVAGHQTTDLLVRVGEWDAQTSSERFPHEDNMSVKSIVAHENYTAEMLYNDVALLILYKPVQNGPHIGTVCLPQAGTALDSSRCFVSGWGKDIDGEIVKYRVILAKRNLSIVPRAKCQTDLRKTRLGPLFELHESFICAGEQLGNHTCIIDGGSPLVCPMLSDPTKYQQAGIVSWDVGCGKNNTLGVYVDIARFRPWIDSKMAAENIDNSSYTF